MSDRYAQYQELKFDRPHPRVLRITIASSIKMNAMSARLHGEISAIWRDVDADPTVSAVIITGSEKAFSAGGDLAHERKCCDDYDMRMQAMKEARDLVLNMINCSKPIVSANRNRLRNILDLHMHGSRRPAAQRSCVTTRWLSPPSIGASTRTQMNPRMRNGYWKSLGSVPASASLANQS